MTYTPVVIDEFRGLDLNADPIGGSPSDAIDLLNVTFDRRGRVRTRDGSSTFSTSDHAHAVHALAPSRDSLLAFRNTGAALAVDLVSSLGVVTAGASSWGNASSTFTSAARIGTPTVEAMYIASANETVLRKWNITANSWADSTGRPELVAVTPWDNRLVQARFMVNTYSPANNIGSPSTVYFSDAGAPDTYTAGDNAYIHLTPGDGEGIVGMCAWRDLLFVFKPSAAFVFYGTSTDGTGKPVFNYRRIELPEKVAFRGKSDVTATVGTLTNYPVVAAAADGVYFLTQTGVWRTTGGLPEKASGPLDPLFALTSSTPYGSMADDGLIQALHAAGDYVFVSFTNDEVSPSRYLMVFDRLRGTWSVWSVPATVTVNSLVAWDKGLGYDNRVYFPSGVRVAVFDETVTTELGNALSWRWQSAFSDLGDPAEKVVRESVLWGSGSPTVSVFTDHGSTDSNAAAVTLGVSPAVAEGYHRVAYAGNLFSLKFSGTSAATVNRAEFHVREKRLAGAKS